MQSNVNMLEGLSFDSSLSNIDDYVDMNKLNKIKKYHFVYITTNLINGKQYIGDHSCDNIENDTYLGSGVYFLNALNEYGIKNFKRKIIQFFETKEEAFNVQEKYIKQYNTLVPNGYNMSPQGGFKNSGMHSEESKKKMSESHKGKPAWNKGKVNCYSQETKLKWSKSRKGRPCNNKKHFAQREENFQ